LAALRCIVAGKKKRVVEDEDVDFRLKAHLERLNVQLGSRQRQLAEVTVTGLLSDVAVHRGRTVLRTRLQGFRVTDPHPHSRYRRIATVEDTHAALELDVTLFHQVLLKMNQVLNDFADMWMIWK